MAAGASKRRAKAGSRTSISAATGPNANIPELMSAAAKRHERGDLEGAGALYARVLEGSPDHPHALHRLGVIAYQQGDHGRATSLIARAVALLPDDAGAFSNLGAAQLASGNLAAAEESFRRAAALQPGLAEAHSNLAAVLNDLGRREEAIAAYRAAQQAAPEVPRFVKRLGDLYLEHEQYDDAAQWFGHYLAMAADDAEVHNNLAHCLERLGRLEDATAHYRQAAALSPDSPEINNNLACALLKSDNPREAELYFERVLSLGPDDWERLANVAGVYVRRREPTRAIPLYERLIREHPDDAALHNDHAVALSMAGRYAEAEAHYEAAVRLKPDYLEAWNNFGSMRMLLGDWSGAIACFRKAIEFGPRSIEPHLNLCLSLSHAHRTDEAYLFAKATVLLESYRPRHFSNPHKVFRGVCDFDAIAALGDLWQATEDLKIADFSANFLEMLVLADTESRIDRLSGLHRRWYREIVRPATERPLPSIDLSARSGKLRIGILSSDLYNHSVAKFVLPVLSHYDRERFEIYCYSPTEKPGDSVQALVKTLVADFKVIRHKTDREFAEIIRSDDIDILFELNGFTRDTKLRVLAYKPAPVQIYWLGYPFTTGVEEIDYILLDPDLKPVNEDWLVEKPLLMPESWVCFGDLTPEPISDKLPVERNGVITFGSLNNPYKLTREIIALWSRVMKAVPESRFLYVRPECRSFTMVANITKEFERNGIARDRLYFVNNRKAGLSHLAYYDEIDITLDTFPLTGGTTTCDTLWMGTPVVTKYGPNMHQRLSYSMLKTLRLDGLCVTNDDDYVRVAAELANDFDSLRLLRRELRRSVLESPLGNAEDFSRKFCDLMAQVAKRHGLR